MSLKLVMNTPEHRNKKHIAWLKKLGFQEILIDMGMFDFRIVAVIGKVESLNEYIQFKLEDPEFDAENGNRGYPPRGKCLYRTGFVPIIWIPKKPRTPREYATLAHECMHAMRHVMHWAGLNSNEETEEVETHGVSHIIDVILSHARP